MDRLDRGFVMGQQKMIDLGATGQVGALAEAVRELTPSGSRLVILVDGGSGAGKTSLAQALAARLRQHEPDLQLVSLDSAYPGWSGLAEGAAMVSGMLGAATGRPTGHPTWNWQANQNSGFVPLDPHASIIIEGCGALTATNRALATAGVWVEVDEATRKKRALARDGEGFAPWWDMWAAQEREHWRLHQPWRLADVVVGLATDGPNAGW